MGAFKASSRMFAAVALATGGAATAEWREARSSHFIVYADDSESGIRDLATRLERFDAVVRRLHKFDVSDGQASNPLTVFVLSGRSSVQKLYGGDRDIAGFYVPRASGSVAFTPGRGDGDGGLQPQIVLFHEYGHHLLLGNSTIAYPNWFSEGYAEFVSTTRFDKASAMVGVAAQHRAYGLIETNGISIERLLDPRPHKLSDVEREALYGRGWLMTHWLMFDPARFAKFNAYLKFINDGMPPLAAATKAFGDLKALDRDLNRYLRASTLPAMAIQYVNLPAITVTVNTLSPGARALMPFRQRSVRGVNATTSLPLYTKAAALAARYPDDALAQSWLAEMAYDAKRDDEAEAAADRALAVDPKSVQAMLYKAQVRLRRAAEAKSTDKKVWADARSWIVKANRIDPDCAWPLALFYRSFEMADQPPTASAAKGLERAFELIPQDGSLRMALVGQKLVEGDLAAARTYLRPIAFDPHAAPDNPAAKLLAVIDTLKDPKAAAAAMKAMEAAGEGEGD
ncbi:tetratricopeptide repeat protein [uncultured Sphingomonas sp.]|uniref:tetratricopeptide repeat protein n=1 Tax=uncultured Sphingomonas sp. TaxID=158754 RepID=UPI0035CB1BC5